GRAGRVHRLGYGACGARDRRGRRQDRSRERGDQGRCRWIRGRWHTGPADCVAQACRGHIGKGTGAMDGRLQIFTGNANPALARAICESLEVDLGRAIVTQWRNDETRVKLEENVRGSDVFVVQPTCNPVNHHLMELLLMIDALHRASASRITAVIPYYGYARQEKKSSGREPISAKLVSNLLTVAGATRVMAVDLHSPAIEGFFDIPVDHLRAAPLLAQAFRHQVGGDIVVVSPDAGGVSRAQDFRTRAKGSLA